MVSDERSRLRILEISLRVEALNEFANQSIARMQALFDAIDSGRVDETPERVKDVVETTRVIGLAIDQVTAAREKLSWLEQSSIELSLQSSAAEKHLSGLESSLAFIDADSGTRGVIDSIGLRKYETADEYGPRRRHGLTPRPFVRPTASSNDTDPPLDELVLNQERQAIIERGRVLHLRVAAWSQWVFALEEQKHREFGAMQSGQAPRTEASIQALDRKIDFQEALMSGLSPINETLTFVFNAALDPSVRVESLRAQIAAGESTMGAFERRVDVDSAGATYLHGVALHLLNTDPKFAELREKGHQPWAFGLAGS